MSPPLQRSGRSQQALPAQFGHYSLERKLAEGGMAEVFLAYQQGFGGFQKQVVVKRILPQLSTHTDFVQMFLNEARLAARLSHSNVVQVIEAGEIDGRYYIAMEYIDGADLKPFYDDAERTGAPIPPGIACRIIADLLSGLHYAHTATDNEGKPLGIVHRDVSPQNVLITRSGTVKIVDFGIAKATHASTSQTRVGQVKGKISYLSPEQAMGRSLDARSDVFACGIILWELVTGARLFSRPNDMAAIMAITEEDLPTVRSIRSELPPALDNLLRQALARSLNERYPSAQAMQQELEALIRSQGWAGDHRTLERYMQQRLGGHTPHFGAPVLKEDVPAFDANATIKASAVNVPLQAPPAAAPSVSASDVATQSMPAQNFDAGLQPPYPDPTKPRTPSGMRPIPPYPSQGPHRTPSEMRQMPLQQSGGVGKRIAVVTFVALLAGLGALYGLEWSTKHNQPTVSSLGSAQVVVEVSEPAMVDIDGKRARIAKTGELALAIGHQVTLTATTTRGNGAEVTRTIALPPARDGERIPIKIAFP